MIVMKKTEKTQKPMGFFNVGFFKKTIGSNQIGPNQAHPAYMCVFSYSHIKNAIHTSIHTSNN